MVQSWQCTSSSIGWAVQFPVIGSSSQGSGSNSFLLRRRRANKDDSISSLTSYKKRYTKLSRFFCNPACIPNRRLYNTWSPAGKKLQMFASLIFYFHTFSTLGIINSIYRNSRQSWVRVPLLLRSEHYHLHRVSLRISQILILLGKDSWPQ